MLIPDRFPTLPSPLSAALTTAGLTKFRSAVKAAGLVKSLSDTPRVTIFAPQNSGIRPGFKVLQHTITGDLHLSPDLFSNQPFTSDAGTQITVTFNNGALYANGIKIIRTDLITKNGVVHVLEKAFPNYL